MNKYAKTYLEKSNAKKLTFSNGGEIIKVSILKSEIDKIPVSLSKKGEEYVNFEIGNLKTPTEYATHSIFYSTLEGASPSSPKKEVKKEDDNFDW